MTDDGSTVRVAVRIRPQLPREVIDMCRVCTNVTPNEPQVTLGADKSFTYDYVFDAHVDQSTIYDTCAHTLVQGSLEGYNATVLAYGQTGSGKTYTMGTGFDVNVSPAEVGIIPRAIHHLFMGIEDLTEKAKERGEPPPQFKIAAQFLELYNEEIIDLFDPTQDYSSGKGKSGIKIHEDSNHCIYVTGVKSERIGSAEEALKWLKQGALSRTTASTQMNSQSSRSHAIFTLHIKQQRLVRMDEADESGGEEKGGEEFETLSAKFHFVDLAGSERLKRTGATGERAKEGISINCGLLALGNVISALGDLTKKVLHVPYRDSKLTRLLQDSLGGNSRTLMIACVSPCDRDFMETLNTLKYANRARNIQNKVVINQDKSSRTIALLKKEIQQLQLELLEYKQGKRVVNEDGIECVNDMFHENTLLQNEVDNLRTRVKGMQETIESLSSKNSELLAEKAMSAWINSGGENSSDDISQMIKGYMIEIEGLRAKLLESENICAQLRKTISRTKTLMSSPMRCLTENEDPDLDSFLEQAKKGIQKESELLSSKKSNISSDQSESDSESSSSECEETNEYSSELANLNSEIILKQKLIEELEKAQKRLNSMKQHYEDKLNQLQAKILATQQERDTVLASLSNKNKQPTDKIKKIKDEYEKKISEMQKEMKSLQSAKKEHATLIKNQSRYEGQIKSLNNEVMEMKRIKVRLMNKMKDEAAKHKEVETRRNREIAKLKKQSRVDANLIRNLEAEKRAKAAVLKRKQEEVTALRRVAKFRHNANNSQPKGSPKVAKQRWIALEKNILENAMNKQSLITLEKDMERQMEARKELQEELKSKLNMLNDPRFHSSSVLMEEIDTIEDSLEHIQNTISDIQNEIIQVEETKAPFESGDLLSGIRDVSEAAYILDKLYSMALNQSCLVAQKDVAVRELEAETDQLKKEGAVQEQLLKHLVGSGLKSVSPASEMDSSKSSRSSSPTDNKSTCNEQSKYRRRTAHPQELLFPSDIPPPKGSQSALASPEIMPPPPPLTRSLTTIKVHSVPASPVMLRKGNSMSPRTNRKTYIISSNHPSMERGLDASPPSSPPVYRRQTSREENVFSRLTSQPAPQNFHRSPGKISLFTARRGLKSALYCTHVVEGHHRAVLALEATDDNLFTASRDRTVVMWDLREMREVQCFFNHPNNVVCVKYDPLHRLLFSVSASCCKVWDVRMSKCVKTLSSYGMTTSLTSQSIGSGSEPQMNAIALNHKGQTLYTAAGDRVRVWDLRKFSVVGKLVGGHQAAVMCMAIEQGTSSQDVIITGSKDHYIKVFDVYPEIGGSISPRVTLEPPHYDGIQCLAIKGSALFSGSRDCIIKKWSLDQHELLLSLNGAHKDWVTGLCFSPCQSMLLSSSRDGTVRMWSTDTCTQLADIKAHSTQINCITSNSSHIFTAASSGEVKMWRQQSQLSGQQDIMSMSTGHILQLSV